MRGLCGLAGSFCCHPPTSNHHKGVVASDNETASRVGAEVLEKGGSAVDAAAATALALGAVSPRSSGLGGSGFAIIYVVKEKQLYAIDFREEGPAAIAPELFRPNGKLDAMLSRVGGLAVAAAAFMWRPPHTRDARHS